MLPLPQRAPAVASTEGIIGYHHWVLIVRKATARLDRAFVPDMPGKFGNEERSGAKGKAKTGGYRR